MSQPTPSLTAIVAATLSNGIGLNGGLPWRLPGEMKYFAKATTTTGTNGGQNAVIMGRKTWESIPAKFRPLKDRQNLVISKAGVDIGDAKNTSTHTSLSHALSSVSEGGKAFLIGGSQLYNLALTSSPPIINRVLLTRVLKDFECDTFLHDFTRDEGWVKKGHEELCSWIGFEVDEENEEKGVQYRYEMWVRESSE